MAHWLENNSNMITPSIATLSALLLAFSCLSHAQYSCVSNGKAVASDLPSCDYLNNTYHGCNSLKGDALNACICTQKLFSSIFDCESEYRLCLSSYEEDNEMQQVVANWHSECDKYISFTPTTPVLSTPVFTIPPHAVCSEIDEVCSLGGSVTRGCKSSYTAPSQSSSLSNCLCQSSLLSADSVCGYDGNITCSGVSATLSNLNLWMICPSQAAAYQTASTSAGAVSPTIIPAPSSSLFQPSSSSMASSPVSAAGSSAAPAFSPVTGTLIVLSLVAILCI